MTTTEKPRLSRTHIVLIVLAVLGLAGVSIGLVNLTAGPSPVSYQVTARGNVRASWFSDSSNGTIDVSHGWNAEHVQASTLTVSVDSTLLEGAYCSIEGPNGETYVDSTPADVGGGIVTATCSTPAK